MSNHRARGRREHLTRHRLRAGWVQHQRQRRLDGLATCNADASQVTKQRHRFHRWRSCLTSTACGCGLLSRRCHRLRRWNRCSGCQSQCELFRRGSCGASRAEVALLARPGARWERQASVAAIPAARTNTTTVVQPNSRTPAPSDHTRTCRLGTRICGRPRGNSAPVGTPRCLSASARARLQAWCSTCDRAHAHVKLRRRCVGSTTRHTYPLPAGTGDDEPVGQ